MFSDYLFVFSPFLALINVFATVVLGRDEYQLLISVILFMIWVSVMVH
jgi:hypothetical protein